jgi:hypothetical protein
MTSDILLFETLSAPRYMLGWVTPAPERYRTAWPRTGLDLFAPGASPPGGELGHEEGRAVAHIPIPTGTSLVDLVAGVAGTFGQTIIDSRKIGELVHPVITCIEGQTMPVAQYVRETGSDRRRKGFRYRIEDSTGRQIAVIDCARSLNLAGPPHWACRTAAGGVMVARRRPGLLSTLSLDETPLRLIKGAKRVWDQFHGPRWAETMTNGPRGWDLIDETGRTTAWLAPPSTCHSRYWTLVGPDGASLEGIDPVVPLFCLLLMFTENRKEPNSSQSHPDWLS